MSSSRTEMGIYMKFYQVDSFTDQLFAGNPAGVCILEDKWLPEAVMQKIAMENNLSETAFVLLSEMGIRWFTPVAEVDLCGHATLAAAHVLFHHEKIAAAELVFQSYRGKGTLRVTCQDQWLTLDFPQDAIQQIQFEDRLDCFQFPPKEVWRGTGEYLLVFENENQIKEAVCQLEKAAQIDLCGFIITAKSDQEGIDFVSRYFSPKYGIDEDPVTGSAHTLLVPYWKEVLKKDTFVALQVSKRGGRLLCKATGDRVKISGSAVTFLIGEILL